MTDLRAGSRVKVLAGLVAIMFAALTTRLWFLQVLAAEEYQREAVNNAVRLVDVPARRGRILDTHGNVLVDSRASLVITMNREEAGDHKEEILFRLSQLLDVPAAELGARLDDTRYYAFSAIPIAIDVPRPVVLYMKEHAREFPGVDVVELPVRTYPEHLLAAHVLGYLGQISKAKLQDPAFAAYEPGDEVGVSGIEAVDESELVGTDGVIKYRVNSAGRNLGEIGQLDPVPGEDVELTLDLRIQRLAEDSLENGMLAARSVFDSYTGSNLRANAGAVVVIDPETGAIEAMASSPTFQPGLFTRPMSNHEYDRRFNTANTGYPLINRTIQSQYAPGSTYKPFIALSALSRRPEDGAPNQTIVSTSRYYGCPPSWTVPFNEDDPEAIQYVFDNWTTANLGFMNLARALSQSCDTIFYPMGYEYWRLYYPPPSLDGIEGNDDEAPKEPLQKDLRAIGFGEVTNVDLPFEKGGRVPDAVWKAGIHEEFPKLFPEGRWVPGDFVLMTIGQGDTLVTPLQLAAAYAALENDGHACVPHLLDRVLEPDGTVVRSTKPSCRHRWPFSQQSIRYVREALVDTVRTGTASGAFAGFPFGRVWVAGKTGTAQVDNRQDNSWFAAMTEANGERHVVVVLVEQGGHGSTTAAPIARNIIEGIYGLQQTQAVGAEATD
ncbi:MAG TPA: penicillin-binding protein 2 [Actinomycetota bacterium]|nr:penicillin-binding protein 2 [Actinomycetota bacterium]